MNLLNPMNLIHQVEHAPQDLMGGGIPGLGGGFPGFGGGGFPGMGDGTQLAAAAPFMGLF